MITMCRLRSKYGGTIEDREVGIFSVPLGMHGWQFIGKLKHKVSKEVFSRYSMIYIPDSWCTVHDSGKCYCYEI